MDYKFETEFKASVVFECNIAVGGWTYLIIYGKHINIKSFIGKVEVGDSYEKH